ncbi:MAG: hypothetical protein CME64_06340 [Halobacteriovoraceae bacterium]|nr:hypothetical protein [Halobacteriovoraceae bacterium]|tara:strand:- start:80649 stop:81185 length:537 start_codon:yes stop_codon:yes gene_type:complete
MRLILIFLSAFFVAQAKDVKNVKVLKSKAKESLKKRIQARKQIPLVPQKAKIQTTDIKIPSKVLVKHAEKAREIKKRKLKHQEGIEELITSTMDKGLFAKMLASRNSELKKFKKAEVSKFKKLKDAIKTKKTSFNQEISRYLYQDKEMPLIKFKQISKILLMNPKFKERYQRVTKQTE